MGLLPTINPTLLLLAGFLPTITPTLLLLAKAPPHALPKGREFILAVFEDVGMVLLPLGKGWDGAHDAAPSS